MSFDVDKKKRVLILAYYFPPLGMGGVQRVSKFVKYLPSFGWEPVVLTVKDIDYFSLDDSLLKELPESAKIYRTGSFDPLRLIYLIKKIFRTKTSDPNPPGADALRNSEKAKRFFPRQRRGQNDTFSFRGWLKFINLLFFPDNKIGWFPFALIKGIKICRKEKIDLLFSTSPPLTCHLVAFFLKKLTGIQWVADYRDPYMTYQDEKSSTSFKKILLKKLQKLFLKKGEGFIGVTQMIASGLKEVYPEVQKIEVLPNGYDQKDFEHKPWRRKDIFTIVYFGTFSPDCPAEPFLKALHNLLQQGKIDKGRVKFIDVGLSMGVGMEDLVNKFELNEITELKGYLPHKEGIQELLGADLALLTLAESSPAIIPGKAYEYLGAQNPILAIVPLKSEARRLIKSLSAGKVVSPDNLTEIENAILSFYREFETGKLFLKVNPQKTEKYERKYLTSRLVCLFDDILKRDISRSGPPEAD